MTCTYRVEGSFTTRLLHVLVLVLLSLSRESKLFNQLFKIKTQLFAQTFCHTLHSVLSQRFLFRNGHVESSFIHITIQVFRVVRTRSRFLTHFRSKIKSLFTRRPTFRCPRTLLDVRLWIMVSSRSHFIVRTFMFEPLTATAQDTFPTPTRGPGFFHVVRARWWCLCCCRVHVLSSLCFGRKRRRSLQRYLTSWSTGYGPGQR